MSLWLALGMFLLSALVIAWAGLRLARLADELADRTGMGEAVTGTMFLGLTTALPGLAASITAALDGRPALAVSNALGGIAIQTTFLAVADIAYTRANLEHAAASIANMIQTALLILLLTLVLLGLTGPDVSLAHIHPVTPILLVAAGLGFILVFRSSRDPMWHPKQTLETVADIPSQLAQRASLLRLLAAFIAVAVVVTLAGAVVAVAVGVIADETAISQTVAGTLLSGVATSLPELATTLGAVRAGALTLAVSDIVGGNFFDVLFVFAADLFYFQGSIYHAPGVGENEEFLAGLAVALNTTLLVGLLYRQDRGPGNIGFESVLILLLYISGLLTLAFLM